MFRNRLILLAIIGFVITALLVAFAATKVLRIAAPNAPSIVTGIWQNLLLALFGAIGAFISGLPSLSSAARLEAPFTMAAYQLALKLATGGMFAMLGVLAIQSQFVQGEDVAPFKSFGGGLLLWGLIFGGSQQILTGIFDRQAAHIEGLTPQRVLGASAPPAVTSPNGRR
jgi:hypothetical protein